MEGHSVYTAKLAIMVALNKQAWVVFLIAIFQIREGYPLLWVASRLSSARLPVSVEALMTFIIRPSSGTPALSSHILSADAPGVSL